MIGANQKLHILTKNHLPFTEYFFYCGDNNIDRWSKNEKENLLCKKKSTVSFVMLKPAYITQKTTPAMQVQLRLAAAPHVTATKPVATPLRQKTNSFF